MCAHDLAVDNFKSWQELVDHADIVRRSTTCPSFSIGVAQLSYRLFESSLVNPRLGFTHRLMFFTIIPRMKRWLMGRGRAFLPRRCRCRHPHLFSPCIYDELSCSCHKWELLDRRAAEVSVGSFFPSLSRFHISDYPWTLEDLVFSFVFLRRFSLIFIDITILHFHGFLRLMRKLLLRFILLQYHRPG